MAETTLTGRIARERIKRMEVPRPPAGTVEGFRALGDCSGVVADVMDELAIHKWRLETVEINGEVQIGDVRVECGDLVIADDTSVVFVPRARILDVLALAQKKAAAEEVRCRAIEDGVPVVELIRST